MNIKKNDIVRLKRDISRVENNEYAKEGEIGTVEEVFFTFTTGHPAVKIWHAKVRIEEVLKTFRLTSLEVVH